ncbi:MAG: zinc-ribbon domain-containing protein [Bryobacterales bacterium]|nr:zinc-ribbon domain-containing protein [Bryobacterales bacterium]
MAYCSQCGNEVRESDVFCRKCGSRQPVSGRIASDPLGGMSPRTAAVLCYIPFVGWIASIVVLAASRFREDLTIRFHAFQGLYLFVAWLIVDHVISPVFRGLPGHVPPVDNILKAAVLVVWIFMMVKAAHDERYSLPIIGELAARSISER